MNCRTHEHRHFERTLRSTDTIPGPRLAEGRLLYNQTACCCKTTSDELSVRRATSVARCRFKRYVATEISRWSKRNVERTVALRWAGRLIGLLAGSCRLVASHPWSTFREEAEFVSRVGRRVHELIFLTKSSEPLPSDLDGLVERTLRSRDKAAMDEKKKRRDAATETSLRCLFFFAKISIF